MARPKFGQLYQVKGSPNWVFQKKGFPGRIDTGTSDRFRAEQFMRAATAKVGDPTPSPEENLVAEGLKSLAGALNPDPNAKPTSEVKDSENAAKPDLSNVSPLFTSSPLPIPPTASQSTNTANSGTMGVVVPINKAANALEGFKSRFNPAKRERLFGAMGSGLARINAIGYEIGLGFGGFKLKGDYIFSNEDLEIMKTAFEMGIDELFHSADPQWWHLLIIGNASMIVSSIPYIEKKPKEIKTATPPGDDNGQ